MAKHPLKQVETYQQHLRRKWLVLLVMLLLTGAAALASLMAGSAGLSLGEVLSALAGRGAGQTRTIVWNVRMPRIAAAMTVGVALAMCGCIMQNVLRNPLASASTLGVSQGASFGAAVSIICLGAGTQSGGGSAASLTITHPGMVTLCAFLGGMATTAVILALSRLSGVTPSVMVLAGVAISAMFSGGTTLVQYFADDVMVATVVHWTFGNLGRAGWGEIVVLAGVAISAMFSGGTTLVQYFADDVMVATVVHWTFGNLGRAGWGEIALIGGLSLAAFLFFLYHRWNYNVLESGVPTARSLGVPVGVLVPASMAVCALISSVAVAFVGCINFIGLIASHIMRRFVGNDFRFLIPCSALCGAALLLASDIVCRMLASPAVLPIGALTSFLGAPLFLWLIIRRGRVS